VSKAALVTLTFDLLTLKVVSESRVTWATSVPILVFLGLSVLDLGPMYATDRRTSDRRQTKASLNAPAYQGRGHNKRTVVAALHRDEQFADDTDDGSGSVLSDRRHFDEILAGYRLILTGKRVDPVDIRVKTGWWADTTATATSSCGSAGKVSHHPRHQCE